MSLLNFRSEKTVFTRMCIGEAIVELLQDSDLKHLKIYEIVRRAGVSRMTFYNYYATPKAALEDYLQIIIASYLTETASESRRYRSYEHILYALNFFDRYRNFFLTMKSQGLYSVLIDSVNTFVTEEMSSDEELSVYRRYSYAGSLLNCFLMWEEGGKRERVEDVARIMYELYGRQ